MGIAAVGVNLASLTNQTNLASFTSPFTSLDHVASISQPSATNRTSEVKACIAPGENNLGVAISAFLYTIGCAASWIGCAASGIGAGVCAYFLFTAFSPWLFIPLGLALGFAGLCAWGGVAAAREVDKLKPCGIAQAAPRPDVRVASAHHKTDYERYVAPAAKQPLIVGLKTPEIRQTGPA
jgi:hypothetical protein